LASSLFLPNTEERFDKGFLEKKVKKLPKIDHVRIVGPYNFKIDVANNLKQIGILEDVI